MFFKFLRFIRKSFLKLDFYGVKIELYIDSKRTLKSDFGAFVSFAILFLTIFLSLQNVNQWFNMQKLSTISSSRTTSVTELLANNKSVPYVFNYSNYYIYFSLTANFPNGSRLYPEDLLRYFVHRYAYLDSHGREYPLESEKCFTKDKTEFLMLEIDSSKINETSKSTYCLRENSSVVMGFFPDQFGMHVYHPEIIYYVEKCVNSSKINYSCASEQEIEEMAAYMQVQSSLPRTLFDFNNPTKPRMRTYDLDLHHFDLTVSKMNYAWLQPVFLSTDYGLIFNDYFIDSVDFNTERLFSETSLRKKETDVLFKYSVSFGPNSVIYYRLNEKIYMILSSFGGFFNVLFLIGMIICSTYNRLRMQHKLVNVSFSNMEKSVPQKEK